MDGLQVIRNIDNLNRAWRWIRSNPDAQYKSYFRTMYSAYAICSDELLKDLSDRLKRKIYVPSPTCKVFLPKPSGVLRPYTLLTVEDQIVYQAAINVVAEKLYSRIRKSYYSETFAHLYAGKTSIWFYRKWKDGYGAFNEACRDAYNRGYRYAASFDLTACYDSVDHGVLRHFLQKCGCDKPFCETLTKWLSIWTSTDSGIYHEHGIPQGPLSSGLLAELVLHYFDKNRGKPNRVRYLRYVDDIRLFAKKRVDLLRMLIHLDELSKDIGLFPQTSKIEIHKVIDIERELKSVSHPPEDAIKRRVINQKKVRERIKALSKGFKIVNLTRFKYILGHATPHSSITNRLWRIYAAYPELYLNIVRYLQRYPKFPRSVSREIARRLRENPLYASVTASFIDVANGRMEGRYKAELSTKIKKIWRPRNMQHDLLAAAGRWLIVGKMLTNDQVQSVISCSRSWWGRTQLVYALTRDQLDKRFLRKLDNLLLRDSSMDVSLAAAVLAMNEDIPISKPIRDINRSAKLALKRGGVLKGNAGAICGINLSIERMVGAGQKVNWRGFFGSEYRKAEKQIVCITGYYDTDVTAWVNAMDVFNDWLLFALHNKDARIGQYQLGTLGGSLNNRRRNKEYPNVSALAKGIHETRYRSNLSHSIQLRNKKATGPIQWDYFKIGKKLLRNAIGELALKWGDG